MLLSRPLIVIITICSQRVQRFESAGGQDELRGQEILFVVQRNRQNSSLISRYDVLYSRLISVLKRKT